MREHAMSLSVPTPGAWTLRHRDALSLVTDPLICCSMGVRSSETGQHQPRPSEACHGLLPNQCLNVMAAYVFVFSQAITF